MKTVEEIYEEMLEVFRRETGAEASAVSDLSVKLYAVAAQVYGLYAQAEWLSRQCFPQTAQGEELDKHAKLRGVTRRRAVPAEGLVRFYVDRPGETAAEVPRGTVCMTAAGVRFLTQEDAAVAAGELFCEVKVAAAQAGAAGNVGQGTIVYMALPPTGIVACANPEPLAGGKDQEGDEALRQRVLATFARLANGANSAFYHQAAMSFEGVAAATVLPRNRGVGTVDLVLAARKGVPDQELLEAVQAYFDRVREIAVDVKVLPPTVETVDVSVQLWAQEGRDWEETAAAVRERLEGWFCGERLGQPLPRARLISLIYGVDGVANCRLTSPAEDLPLDSVTLPVLGELDITRGGTQGAAP